MSGEGVAAMAAHAPAPKVPRLAHEDAEAVGCALHDNLEKLGLALVNLKAGQVLDPEAIVPRDDLAWADAVQRVLAFAAEKQAEREGI